MEEQQPKPFDYYDFVDYVDSLRPEQLLDIALAPLCILILTISVAMLVNHIIASKLSDHFDGDDVTLKRVFLTSLRGLPSAWICCTGIYWMIRSLVIEGPIVDFLGYLIFAVIIFNLFQILARSVCGFIDLYTTKNNIQSNSLINNILTIVIYSLGIMLILEFCGISIAPFLGAMGVVGMAVALGLQEPLANIFSGLFIITSKQFKINDYIKLSTGEEGMVTDITWRYTTILAIAGNAIVVPNKSISAAVLTNYSMPEQDLTIKVRCGVAYSSDLEQVERVTLEVAQEVINELEEDISKPPQIFFDNYGESSIDFFVNLHCSKFKNQFQMRHEFIKRLTKRYREEGIDIPFPIRTVYNASN